MFETIKIWVKKYLPHSYDIMTSSLIGQVLLFFCLSFSFFNVVNCSDISIMAPPEQPLQKLIGLMYTEVNHCQVIAAFESKSSPEFVPSLEWLHWLAKWVFFSIFDGMWGSHFHMWPGPHFWMLDSMEPLKTKPHPTGLAFYSCVTIPTCQQCNERLDPLYQTGWWATLRIWPHLTFIWQIYSMKRQNQIRSIYLRGAVNLCLCSLFGPFNTYTLVHE